MSSLVKDWNAGLSKAHERVQVHNERIMRQVQDGVMTAEEALTAVLPRPRELHLPSRQWASHFLKSWGWSLLSRNSDTQTSLPYGHEDMQAARDAYRSLVETQGVHAGCILNFDQLWRTAWSSNARLLFKLGSPGEKTSKKKAPARASKKVHTIKHARRGLTALTSSWSDGSAGPICFCIPEGRLNASEIADFNKANVGRSYIVASGTKSHFMSADSLLQIFEQVYSPALRLQRQKILDSNLYSFWFHVSRVGNL